MKYTPFISTSFCPVAALFWALQGAFERNKIVCIDVNKATEHCYVYDLSNDEGQVNWINSENEKARNRACAFQEVLLKGVVPSEAISHEFFVRDIPKLTNDPGVLTFLGRNATRLH